VIIAANHISESDPLALAHFVYEAGRYPVYLAKAALFSTPVVGAAMRGTGQIPVHRDRADAALALKDAEKALVDGECLMFYPEGSCTRDPELWPMTGQTGVARMALTTGAKVVPVATWGAHELLPYKKAEQRGLAGSLKKGFHPFPRKTMKVIAGPPIDLSKYEGLPLTKETLRAATDEIMDVISELLGELRGERPPAERYDHHRVLEERRRAAEPAGPAEAVEAAEAGGVPGPAEPPDGAEGTGAAADAGAAGKTDATEKSKAGDS
jgi:1-acyl-sn-glycerol-3-phosphate acyltransferase